jgi:hypothetical protein
MELVSMPSSRETQNGRIVGQERTGRCDSALSRLDLARFQTLLYATL